jgi:hypothetical protein
MEPEQVRLIVAFHGAELHAGYDAHSFRLPGGDGLGETTNGVVVGECNGFEADLPRGANDFRWRSRPIGSGRVSVQVDSPVDGRVSARSRPRAR